MEDFQVPNEKDQPKHVTALSFDSLDEIVKSGTRVPIGDKIYYYLPYWFVEAPGGGWYFYTLDHAPKELKAFIAKSRLGGDNPKPEYKLLRDFPLTKEEEKWMNDGKITDDHIKGDPSKPVVEIWMEGYRATGESATANMLNQFHADSFDEAMKLYMEDNPGDVEVKKIPKNSKSVRDDSFTKEYRIWACRLFDNETDARKSFG